VRYALLYGGGGDGRRERSDTTADSAAGSGLGPARRDESGAGHDLGDDRGVCAAAAGRGAGWPTIAREVGFSIGAITSWAHAATPSPRLRPVAVRADTVVALPASGLVVLPNGVRIDRIDLHVEVAPLVERAMAKLGSSARDYTRVLKVARTVADLAGEEQVGAVHVAEAIQYLGLDRERQA